VSGGGTGAVREGRWTYNASGQLSRRTQDAPALLTADPSALAAAGVAPDSAARLAALARAAGIPLGAAGAWRPDARLSDLASFALRVDAPNYDPKTYEPRTTTYGARRSAPCGAAPALGVTPGAAATRGGTSRNGTAGAQATYSRYFGRRGTRLIELRSGLSATDAETTPYLALPGATVLVGSAAGAAGDGADADVPALSTLALGGNAALATRRRTALWETQAELRTVPARRAKHRLALTADARLDRLRESPGADRLGTFGYQSLGDLAAGRPATFARALAAPDRSAGVWNAFVALGDYWRVGDRLQVLYGARLEGNAYASRPATNPALARALGVDTRRVPNTAALSPRVGFSWQPAKRRPDGFGIHGNNFGIFPMIPRGVLRGRRRPVPQPPRPRPRGPGGGRDGAAGRHAAPPVRGLGGAGGRLVGVGRGRGRLPRRVRRRRAGRAGRHRPGRGRVRAGLHGAAQLARQPRVEQRVQAPGLRPRRDRVVQPEPAGTADANFAGRAALRARRRGRPAGVRGPRRHRPGHGRALARRRARERRVRPRGAAAERPALAQPPAHRVAQPHRGRLRRLQEGRYLLAGSYTVGGVRQQQRGFDGATFGDPRAREWARGDLDVRHQFLVQGGYSRKGVTLTLFGRVQSGLPFTPVVGSDVNGDGLANDRAAVFAPAAADAAGDAALAAGTRALLDGAPGNARACLRRALGDGAAGAGASVAGRNGCEGPWTAALNARLGYGRPLPRVGRRVNLALNLANPLGGLDQLLHGGRTRGWGAPALPDPVLYQVRGFDAAGPQGPRFRYAVNPRFGRTHAGAAGLRPPFRLTLDVALDLGRPIPVQQLDAWLRPGRAGRPGARLTADDLGRRYRRNVPDPYGAILTESDSLLLTRDQSDAITGAQTRYKAAMDSVWTPLVDYLAALPDRFDAAEALKLQEAAVDAAWERSRLHVQAELPRVLSPTQLGLLPWPAGMLYRSKEPMKGIRVFMAGG
jgi:hypothetical protein